MDEWRGVTKGDIAGNGGGGLLDRFGSSPHRLIAAVYPHHEFNFPKPKPFWDWLRSQSVNKGISYWTNRENWGRFVGWLGGELGLVELGEWYSVTLERISQLAPVYLFKKHGMFEVLSFVYPEHSWEAGRLDSCAPSLAQQVLRARVSDLFPRSGEFVFGSNC